MTVTLGTWALPLLVCLAAWAWALCPRAETHTYGVGAFLRGVAAIVASLVAFLVWALLR